MYDSTNLIYNKFQWAININIIIVFFNQSQIYGKI